MADSATTIPPRPTCGLRDAPLSAWVGFAAVVFSGLYVASDVIEALQGGFSDPQLVLTFIAEAAIPFVVVGLYLVQRPKIGVLGSCSAAAYAYSYVFFTGTVVYAIVQSTVDYAALIKGLGTWMTIHGVVMVVSGLGFGVAVIRAGVLPVWTGFTLIVGVLAVAVSQTAPEGVQVVAAAIRAAAFAGMGLALLLQCGRQGAPSRGTRGFRSPRTARRGQTSSGPPLSPRERRGLRQ